MSIKDNGLYTTAIVLAAGSGSRMHSDVKKQYMEICGKPLVYYSLKVFQESFVDEIIMVISPQDREYVQKEIVQKYGFTKVKALVDGGKERYHSVCNGLDAASERIDYVFIHDGARPFVTQEILLRSLEGTLESGASVVGMPVKDTIKIADTNGFAQTTPDRSLVWMIQTPQTFQFSLIRELYHQLIENEASILEKGIHITDDAMVVETFSDKKVKLVEGAYTNIKVTTPDDLGVAEKIIVDANADK